MKEFKIYLREQEDRYTEMILISHTSRSILKYFGKRFIVSGLLTFFKFETQTPKADRTSEKIEFSYWLALTPTIMVCMVPPVIPRIFVAF